ncbi:MAG: DUF2306 domain-containing protein [Pseudomonadota bacterium]
MSDAVHNRALDATLQAAPKRAPAISLSGLWASFQTSSFLLLLTGAILTTLLIVLSTLPAIVEHQAGARILPDVQAFNHAVLVVHVLTAVPPLLIGFFAFSTAARKASPKWHRWAGTAYCVCIWVSAVTGFALATANSAGLVAKAGFGALAIAWFWTTYVAYRTARRKDFLAHRRWMIRSFALTLAVVAIRPMFIVAPQFGYPMEVWYPVLTWLCWVPNLLIGELYLRSTLYSGRLTVLKRRPTRA